MSNTPSRSGQGSPSGSKGSKSGRSSRAESVHSNRSDTMSLDLPDLPDGVLDPLGDIDLLAAGSLHALSRRHSRSASADSHISQRQGGRFDFVTVQARLQGLANGTAQTQTPEKILQVIRDLQKHWFGNSDAARKTAVKAANDLLEAEDLAVFSSFANSQGKQARGRSPPHLRNKHFLSGSASLTGAGPSHKRHQRGNGSGSSSPARRLSTDSNPRYPPYYHQKQVLSAVLARIVKIHLPINASDKKIADGADKWHTELGLDPTHQQEYPVMTDEQRLTGALAFIKGHLQQCGTCQKSGSREPLPQLEGMVGRLSRIASGHSRLSDDVATYSVICEWFIRDGVQNPFNIMVGGEFTSRFSGDFLPDGGDPIAWYRTELTTISTWVREHEELNCPHCNRSGRSSQTGSPKPLDKGKEKAP